MSMINEGMAISVEDLAPLVDALQSTSIADALHQGNAADRLHQSVTLLRENLFVLEVLAVEVAMC
jgi:hypothetical protein